MWRKSLPREDVKETLFFWITMVMVRVFYCAKHWHASGFHLKRNTLASNKNYRKTNIRDEVFICPKPIFRPLHIIHGITTNMEKEPLVVPCIRVDLTMWGWFCNV